MIRDAIADLWRRPWLGLVYANDWFLTPFRLPAGSLSRVKGLTVSNVFGERFWIDPAGKGLDDQWESWRMFSLSIADNAVLPADLALLLPTSTPKIQEGPAMEEIALLRDEMANMVWGIEKNIPLPHGRHKPGFEAATELRKHYERLAGIVPAPEPEYRAKIRYSVMNAVPENWIPFIPVHDEGNNREIRLQRAAMLRFLASEDPAFHPPKRIRPRTWLLREGLEGLPKKQAYFVHEEEVPRAGGAGQPKFPTHALVRRQGIYLAGCEKNDRQGRGEQWFGIRSDRRCTVAPTSTSAPATGAPCSPSVAWLLYNVVLIVH